MKKTIVLILIALTTLYAQAQEFLVAAGSSSGTYEQFLKEIGNVIPKEVITFKIVPSHGAVENLDKLVLNEVQGAFMHADVIHFRSKAEDMSKYKTLLALFPEEVHFLAPAISKRKQGGVLGFGATVPTINSMGDLTGYKVGAAGGGYITAQVIKLLSDVPYVVVQYGKGDEVLAALRSGEIDVALFVGGAPLPNLKDLGREFKLLAIPSMIQDKLKQVYRPAVVTYNNMSPQGVQTVAADCLFVSKEYKTPRMVNALRQFRASFYANLDELKETPGNHRKWQQVNQDEHGHWPWLELGPANPVAQK